MTNPCENCPLVSDLLACSDKLTGRGLSGEADKAAYPDSLLAHEDTTDRYDVSTRIAAAVAADLVKGATILAQSCRQGPRTGIKVPLLGVVGLPRRIGSPHCMSPLAGTARENLRRGQGILTEGRASKH